MLNQFRAYTTAAVFGICFAGALSAPASAACYFGECGAGTAAPVTNGSRVSGAAPEKQPVTFASHSSWSAVAAGDGTIIIMDEFHDGSKFAIVDAGEKVGLLMTNPAWHLGSGNRYTMKISIDGKAFSATVPALDDTTLGLEDIEADFIATFYHGRAARIEIGQYSADILSLPDAASTIDDAVRYKKTAMR